MFNKTFLKRTSILLSLILLILSTNEIKSQYATDNVDVSFGIKTWDPVHIKKEEKKGSSSASSSQIRFTATNSTYYPFLLKIDFIEFDNLFPKPPNRDMQVSHGTNNLFSCSLHVPGIGYSLRYSYGYWLAPSDENSDENYPYLVPLKEGKTINAKVTSKGKILNSFMGNTGDTVYSMRRGLVTAVPRTETMDFRLSGHDCLEIRHDDGTYMIYRNLEKNTDFTAPGKIILPGQPVGLFSDSLYVVVSLVKVSTAKNQLEGLPITYANGKNNTASFSELEGTGKSVHPWEVVIKELKNKEIKKLQKE
jgi:hypothetical protein